MFYRFLQQGDDEGALEREKLGFACSMVFIFPLIHSRLYL